MRKHPSEVARAMSFLVTIATKHLGAVQGYVVRGLTVMAKPNLPKGRASHTKMTDLRASRAGPERRRRAPWTLRRGMPLAEAGDAGGGSAGEGEGDRAPSGRLKEGWLRQAAGGRVSYKLKYELGREAQFSHGMQIGVSSGRKELEPQQKRDVLWVNLFFAWVGYDANDRGASAVEQKN